MIGHIPHSIYLIDDNEHPFAGWTFDNRGLEESARTAYAQFNFEKVHPEFDTLLKRHFRTVSSGTVTLEANFFLECPDGFSIKLYDSAENLVFGTVTRSGEYTMTDGYETRIPVRGDKKKNSFKAVFDLDKKTCHAYINNRDAGLHMLPDGITDLHDIAIGIEKGYTGTLFARGVKMYADYAVNERFLAPFDDEIPCDWRFIPSGGSGGMKNSVDYTFSLEDTYCFQLEGGNTATESVLEKDIAPLTGDFCFELKFIELSDVFNASFLLNGFGIRAENGKLYLTDGREICAYPHNLWNTLRIETDSAAGQALIRLNGKDKGVFDVKLPEAITSVCIGAGSGSVMKLDDILLFELDPLPADYVPKPVPAPTKGYHVGLHVFSSWRYGFWRGTHDATWDVCSPYDEITPYMGYYDEGIPEVADWENKWFCEHGIDFQLQCWYGPGAITEPLKFPGFSHALHDGYFNSVYKNYSKFAIMWENNFTGTITPEAFEKYLAPYFMEYYFKDPGYYKIDNKPVFSIYNLDRLITPDYFGSVEQARKEMDFLRAYAKREGFDDIILLCAGGGMSEGGVKLREALGVEGTYSYNWGTNSYTAAYQEEQLTTAAEIMHTYADKLVHVPTVGVGFNCVARHDERHPSISIPEYEKIVRWTRDVYLTDRKQFPDPNSWQSKMVLLSCWNEFDEGHYINPSNLHGFGFLDTLRAEFTDAPAHTDERPTENQKKRIDILYPEGHAWLRPERRLPEPKPDENAKVIKVWDFADKATCDRWGYYTHAKEKSVRDGALCGVSDGIDPQIVLDGDAGINADDVDFIRVTLRLKNALGKAVNTALEFYFATEESPALSGGKHIGSVYTPAPDGGFSEAIFVCRKNSKFHGHVTVLRFDPMSGVGSWEIRSIELIKNTTPRETVAVNENDELDIGLPFAYENGVPFVPLYAKCPLMNSLDMAYRWNRAAGEITLLVDEHEMRFTIGSDKCVCDGEVIPLAGKVPAVDGVPAVPLETVCKLCGYAYAYRNGKIGIWF